MKKQLGFSLLSLIIIVIAGCNLNYAVKEEPASSKKNDIEAKGFVRGPLNVKDFGAVGDGKHDDTDAIQRCLIYAASAKFPSKLYFVAAPEVYFPEGTYIVSRTLMIPPSQKNGFSFINVRGDNAVIKQINPEQDIFYFRLAYRNLIEGIAFEGGKRQLKIWTKNKDKAHIIIRDCAFRNSTGFAIDDQLRVNPEILRPKWSGDIMEPYFILSGKNGLPLLSSRNESQWRIAGYNSTALRISRCSFERCRHAMSIWDDWTLVDNCRIETHPEMNGPAIWAGGTLLLENIEGIGHVSKGKEQWWITLDSRRTLYPAFGNASVDLRNVRLKTDSETGWCVVRNEARFKNGGLTAIHADNCLFQGTGSERQSIIHLMEAPNQIVVRNCDELEGKAARLISLGRNFSSSYFSKAGTADDIALLFSNNGSLKVKLPSCFAPYIDSPLPRKIAKHFDRKRNDLISLPEIRSKIVKSLDVSNFGAKGDGISDDSPSFRKALFAAASEKNLTEVLVPNGVYKLDETLELPPNIVVRGCGYVAIFSSPDKKHSIFSGKDVSTALIQNLNFFDCKNAIRNINAIDKESMFFIDNCTFNRFSRRLDETRDFPIYCIAGNGNSFKKNKSRIVISDCTFEYSQMLWHNFQHALIENCWVTGDHCMKGQGAIVNKGYVHIKSLLAVPPNSEKVKLFESKTRDGDARDLRWINNYHVALIDRCRFGNESGGLPIVVNLDSKGVALIQNSWLCMRKNSPGNPSRNVFVDCEKMPELAVFLGNRGYPTAMLAVPEGSQDKLKGHFFHSGNALPCIIRTFPIDKNSRAQ